MGEGKEKGKREEKRKSAKMRKRKGEGARASQNRKGAGKQGEEEDGSAHPPDAFVTDRRVGDLGQVSKCQLGSPLLLRLGLDVGSCLLKLALAENHLFLQDDELLRGDGGMKVCES